MNHDSDTANTVTNGALALQQETSASPSGNYRYLIEVIIFLTFVVFGMAWGAAGTFLLQIKQELRLTLSEASFMTTIVSIANIFGPLMAGFISARIGLRWSFMLATGLICMGIFAPLSPTYTLILVSRFAMGVGGAMLSVYLLPLAMQWFSGKERVIMNGINFLAMNVGIMIALFITPSLQKALGGSWQKTLLLYSLLSILLAAAWLCFGREKTSDTTEDSSSPQQEANFIDALLDRNTWFFTLTGIGSLSFYLTMFTYFPSFYSEMAKTYHFGFIEHAPGIATLVSIPASLLGIWITQKSGLRTPVMRFAGTMLIPSALGMFLIKNPYIIMTAAVLTGIALQLGCGAFYAIPQELPGMNPKKAAYMMGIFFTVLYSVGTFNVWMVGRIIELTGNTYINGFLYVCAVGMVSLVGLYMLPETGPGKKT